MNTVATSSRETLRERARQRGNSREKVRRRHRANIDALLKQLPSPQPPADTPLIAIVDAKPYLIKDTEYTLYAVLLRPIHTCTATVCDPVLLKGCEGGTRWHDVLEVLPAEVQKQIVALVSDGKVGLETYAKERGWVFQRCHFHLIKQLQSLRGARWSTSTKVQLREETYQRVRRALTVKTQQRARQLYDEIADRANDERCPKWFGKRTRGFLRSFQYFRSYREYSQLNLPTTTNAVESLFNRIAELGTQTKGFRTPQSLLRWVTLYIRMNPEIQCNGRKPPQN